MKNTSLRPGTGPDLQGKLGAPSATRTRDLLLRRQLLYPLSYRGQPGPRRPAATTQAPSSVTGPMAERAGLTARPGDGAATVGWTQPLIAMHATKEPTRCRYETS